MITIDHFLKHKVDVVKVTLAGGRRTTETEEDVPAFITSRQGVARDEFGDHFTSATVVFFKPDQDISQQDEVVIDGVTRPVRNVVKARNDRGVHHLEVELQ